MEEYSAVYKCRMCGETVPGGSIECEKAIGCSVGLDGIELIDSAFNITRMIVSETHGCQDGSFGHLEFQGLRKVRR